MAIVDCEEQTTLLRNCSLIAYGLPLSVAANPNAGVAIGAAEIFAKLMTLDVGTRGDYGGIAVNPHHHIRNIHGFVAKLTAAAHGDGFFLGRHLAERSDGYVVLGKGVEGEIGIAAQAGFFGLPFHVDNLANDFLLDGFRIGPGMNGDVLRTKCRQGHQYAQQQPTLVDHDETSAVCQGDRDLLAHLYAVLDAGVLWKTSIL